MQRMLQKTLVTLLFSLAAGITAAKAAGMQAFGYAAMGKQAKLQAAGADQVFASMADLSAAFHRAVA